MRFFRKTTAFLLKLLWGGSDTRIKGGKKGNNLKSDNNTGVQKKGRRKRGKKRQAMVTKLENVWKGWWVCGVRRVQRAKQWKHGGKNNEKVGREKRWRERMIRQQGWRKNSEGEMDRERWLCVILRTPFIYTWNKRPVLACKRLSGWGLKWNWHFQFVRWHVCLGLFTHSSASPTLAILLFLSFSPSHYSFPLPLYKPPPPSISVGLSLACLHPPERPQSNKEIWSRFLYLKPIIPNTSRETHVGTKV